MTQYGNKLLVRAAQIMTRGWGLLKKKKKGNAVGTPLLWLSELCEVMIKLEAPINTNGASSLVKVAWDNKIRPKRKRMGQIMSTKPTKASKVSVCAQKKQAEFSLKYPCAVELVLITGRSCSVCPGSAMQRSTFLFTATLLLFPAAFFFFNPIKGFSKGRSIHRVTALHLYKIWKYWLGDN